MTTRAETAATQGLADERFGEVREIFESQLTSGENLGASVSITVQGETVVDLWGGWADEARTRRWESDTIVNVWSVTKTMTALCALLLADRGELDLYAPVAHYWPEFAVNGKAEVRVSHLLSHSSGLSGWKEPMATTDMFDWDKATSLLAAQEPFWEPGTASGYHGFTQGYLVGEVIRRVTGRTMGTFFREEIAHPLGADFHIGFGPEIDHRVADLVLPAPVAVPGFVPSELLLNIAFNPPIPLETAMLRDWRAAEIGAAGGHGNARAIATVHTLLANGGVSQGIQLLSEAGCRRALEQQVVGDDLVLGMPVRFGLGFGLSGGPLETASEETIFWTGRGGSMVLIDLASRTTFAFAMNRMCDGEFGDPRAMAMVRAMWAALR